MQVLVSVSSVAEAQMVLSAGVRLIDLKETAYGALAALDIPRSAAMIAAVDSYRQQHSQAGIIVSATIGDDCSSAEALNELIQSRLDIGVDVIKLPQTIWADAAYASAIKAFLDRGVKLIAVLSADHFSGTAAVSTLLQDLASALYWGVMIDTIQKSRPLTALISVDLLAFFVRTAKAQGLYVGLAGGLQLAQVDSLADLSPDYLGFRSGLCQNQRREQPLIEEKLHFVMAKVSEFC